jgi:hypothetical protein
MEVGGKNNAPSCITPVKRPGTHFRGGWAGPRFGLDKWGKSRIHWDPIPYRPVRSESLYRQSYPGPQMDIQAIINFRIKVLTITKKVKSLKYVTHKYVICKSLISVTSNLFVLYIFTGIWVNTNIYLHLQAKWYLIVPSFSLQTGQMSVNELVTCTWQSL